MVPILRKNVVLLTVDCLRADHLSCYGYSRPTSPTIDSLASNGLRFTQDISNGGGSPEAFPSILTGSDAPTHWSQYGISPDRTVAKYFKENGYSTGAFHSNAYLSRYYGYNHSFDTFVEHVRDTGSNSNLTQKISSALMEKIDPKLLLRLPTSIPLSIASMVGGEKLLDALIRFHGKIDAAQITDMGIAWIKKQTTSFFLWLHYMDVHSPYLPPLSVHRSLGVNPMSISELLILYKKMARGYGQLTQSDINKIVTVYDFSIRFVDNELGRLVSFIKANCPDTVIILTSDHGEAFGEHGLFNHGNLYEEVIHVPLVISSPNIPPNQIDRRLTCHANLYRIITSLANSNYDLDSWNFPVGVISTALDPFTKTRQISYRTERWKFIMMEVLDESEGPKVTDELLFDLASDPTEKTNVADRFPQQVKIMRSRIQARLRTTESTYDHGAVLSPKEEEDLKERLAKLGYS